MSNKHLIVVSADALVFEDLEIGKDLPIIGKMMKEGALIERVLTIYPSLTHPVHASIMTGCPAGKTTITTNTEVIPGNLNSPWLNRLNQVGVETIFHAAHKAGLKTAACRWPLTAGGGDVIDYLVPEVMGEDMDGHEYEAPEVYRRLGTSECVMDIVEDALSIYGSSHDHPAYDEFEVYCAAEIIRRYQPNLLLIHPGLIDAERHRTGLFTEAVNESVRVTDKWLSMLMDAVRDAGIEEETDLVLISDHGHLNVHRTICPNVLLADAGYIQTDEHGELTHWDAYTVSCGFSAQIYLSRPDDPELVSSVYRLLCDTAEEKLHGFERVFTREEVRERYGLDGNFSFVIETDGLTTFSEDWRRPIVHGLDITDYRFGHSSHGHMPEKGPQPPFLGMGPSFRKGIVIPEGNILNHAPTFAKILGIELPLADGTVAKDLLNML